MRVLSMIGKGFIVLFQVLLQLAGFILKLALGALQIFLMLLSMVLRVFFAFIGGCSV